MKPIKRSKRFKGLMVWFNYPNLCVFCDFSALLCVIAITQKAQNPAKFLKVIKSKKQTNVNQCFIQSNSRYFNIL